MNDTHNQKEGRVPLLLTEECSLFVGNTYYCIVVNRTINYHCFPKYLRYDGNDSEGNAIFSEEVFSVTRDSFLAYQLGGTYRKYNDNNFHVVAVLPNSMKLKPIKVNELTKSLNEDGE